MVIDNISPAPASESWLNRVGRWIGRSLAIVALLATVLGALSFFLALRWSYSSGERAGYVQKFSKKGWVCKTWEGEIAMANVPGVMPELFTFTVRDEAVAAQIKADLGNRVVLSYDQHLGLPSCFGDTTYWVKSVQRVQP